MLQTMARRAALARVKPVHSSIQQAINTSTSNAVWQRSLSSAGGTKGVMADKGHCDHNSRNRHWLLQQEKAPSRAG